jgi:ABC-type dipeptide/oligopeptide/nickel transport system ATPase subunit
MTRTFEDKPATREGGVPLLIGLMGASGSGKTFSALRLATGIQRVTGGDIFCIDTEARRAKHYSDRFRFRHVEFTAPFGSLDYLAAIDHCAKKGAGVIIVDSMSHEHEGRGGLLEQHEEECQRLMSAWKKSRDVVQMTAWAKPKAERRRMINTILQVPVNFIFCFRAKEKLKIVRGKQPESQGFMPIAGEEMVYEMTVNALLMPNSGGVPTWQSNEVGERQMIKLPQQFHSLFAGQRGPLDEDAGEAMAKWAAGDSNQAHAELVAAINDATAKTDLESLIPRLAAAKDNKLVSPDEYKSLRALYGSRQKALEAEGKRKSSPTNAAPHDPDDGGGREGFV